MGPKCIPVHSYMRRAEGNLTRMKRLYAKSIEKQRAGDCGDGGRAHEPGNKRKVALSAEKAKKQCSLEHWECHPA